MTWTWERKSQSMKRMLVSVSEILTASVDTERRAIVLPHPYRLRLTSARSHNRTMENLKVMRDEPPFTFVVSTYGAETPQQYTVSMTAETFTLLLKEHYRNVVQPRERQGEHAPNHHG